MIDALERDKFDTSAARKVVGKRAVADRVKLVVAFIAGGAEIA